MTLKKMASIMMPALALTLVASGGAQAQLVLNGSFEQSNLTAGDKTSFDVAAVANWATGPSPTNVGNDVTFLASPGSADDLNKYMTVYGPFPKASPVGGNFVEADGDPSYSDYIYQGLHGLTIGQKYSVSFYQAAGQEYGYSGPTTEQWAVTLSRFSFADTQLSSMFSLAQGGVGAWQKQTMIFTSDATDPVLVFLAVGTPGGAPPISFLDGVSVQAVPEPSTLIMTSLALIGVGAVSLRRRGNKVAVA